MHLRRAVHCDPHPNPNPNPNQVHLRRAVHCDLFVDSRLCNAHTSATDALWAGTPLLSPPGTP